MMQYSTPLHGLSTHQATSPQQSLNSMNEAAEQHSYEVQIETLPCCCIYIAKMLSFPNCMSIP